MASLEARQQINATILPKGDTGNGIDKIEKTDTSGLVDTYTIYYTNGTTKTYQVTNGADGYTPVKGTDYFTAEEIAEIENSIINSITIPTDLKDLNDDSTHRLVTDAEKSTWNGKYAKPSGGIPKTDLASAVQTSLGKADTALQTHQDISGKEDKSNKVTSISNSSTDTQYPSAKCVYDSQASQDTQIQANTTELTNAKQSTVKSKTFASVDARFEELEDEVNNIENNRGHIWGIERQIASNTSTSWVRTHDSIGKTANATKNGGTVQNDFDNLAPYSEIKTCNYDISTKKIKAWLGDANFKFDGSNGDVYTYFPKTYWKIYQENGKDHILLSDCARSGFTEYPAFLIGRYNASVVSDDGLLHTYSGLVPTTNKTRAQFRTLANTLGTNFSLLDWRYLIVQLLYLVEYANFNSQSMLGNGVQSRKNLKALVAETGTNRVIISSSSGYYVGQIIRIGTSDGGTQVADARKITAITAYSEGGVSGYALTFDGAAVNIAVNNFVCTMAQETGQCDTLGMKSGCLNNDGYHSVIYRGVENIFANIWQWVDGINIKDRVAYICKDHSQYADDTFTSPYKALSYTNGDTNGYATALGFDLEEPLFRFPTAVGGGSDKFTGDYYYQNTGNRVARVGNFNGEAIDGLWHWGFSSGSSVANWRIGARVLIDQ